MKTVVVALGLSFGVGCSVAQEVSPSDTPVALDQQSALRISQAVVGTTPEDFTFLDRSGNPTRLSNYRGKPLLVSFIYTGCFQICPGTTRELQNAVEGSTAAFGDNQFNVISIGFNPPADAPQSLKSFAKQFRIDAPNWEFLSVSPKAVDAVTRAFGFSYLPTPAGFDHILQVTLLDAQGRIAQQIYGEKLTPASIGEPLKLVLSNSTTPLSINFDDLVDRVRLLCTVYDPQTGKYEVRYGLFLEIAGGITFAIVMIVFFFSEWRSQRRMRQAALTPEGRG